MRNITAIILALFCFIASAEAQKPKKPTSSEIYESIKKLNFLGSVLYVAAHPDDENTRLISYLSNHVKARTAYLSLTRGDGGQNLIGPEIRELLGVIRTQELLEARQIDGGEQRFSRANDFGYSKHPDETFKIWDKDAVLADLIWSIRTFKPDVIINRFSHNTPGSTHGHHTASAMLSVEAFNLASQENTYPKQLEYTSTWQPKRLFFNTSWWFYGSRENFENADKTNLLSVDVGVYYPNYGLSNTEIASLSRSEHKSQGFGSTGTRGSQTEYLELLKGDLPENKSNIFDGIDTSWTRLEGGEPIGKLLNTVEANFNFSNPSASIPNLITAYTLIKKLPNSYWKSVKLKEIKTVIKNCAGLYLEAVTASPFVTKNETIDVTIEAINRSKQPISLQSIQLGSEPSVSKNLNLEPNINNSFTSKVHINSNFTFSTPYWLNKPGTLGMYTVNNQQLIGKPETPKQVKATYTVKILNEEFTYTIPLVYKMNDPVKGEVYMPFDIVPEVSVKLSEDVILFNSNNSKPVTATVKAFRANVTGNLTLKAPDSWDVSPKTIDLKFTNKGEEQQVEFTLTPPNTEEVTIIEPVFKTSSKEFNKQLVEISYNHIPKQNVVLPSQSKLVRLNIDKKGSRIGYIEGAGDVVPESLNQIGYEVTILNPTTLTENELKAFDAIVVGIRAYNTLPVLKNKQDILFKYVEEGGTMVVQYNTTRGLKTKRLAPYPLTLSRDRVTDENAEVTFLAPKHPVLNYPNTITQTDFENWTQERGLYFPNKWDNAFTPILSMNDTGETPKHGSLLVAKYGKGHYVYTGISFFREFPAGVPGGYKLFANILSLGKTTTLK